MTSAASCPLGKIITGDNVEVLSSFPDACIDLVVTSPPYDDLRTYGGHSWNFETLATQLVRVLKPGGRFACLEFSHMTHRVLQDAYDAYSFKLLPLLGKLVARDADSYRYLAESIRKHPDQETLLGLMREAGLEDCSYHNLSGGIVAVHRGYRY